MLPILPALLLLILQGPSSIEKMASDGRLPAALQAVSRQMEANSSRTATYKEADAAVLASLLTLGADSDLSQALLTLLSLDVDEPSTMTVPPQREESDDPPPKPEFNGPDTRSGFETCRRTRDGPR
ncbi:MAG TPA: hypothetical protein VJ835_11125 [Fimbriimonadaceae bacterium]|nr:hypothetical protein [Fimbriimonadaceae bacterium]